MEGECKLFDLLSILSRPWRSSAVGKLVLIDVLGHPDKVGLELRRSLICFDILLFSSNLLIQDLYFPFQLCSFLKHL